MMEVVSLPEGYVDWIISATLMTYNVLINTYTYLCQLVSYSAFVSSTQTNFWSACLIGVALAAVAVASLVLASRSSCLFNIDCSSISFLSDTAAGGDVPSKFKFLSKQITS